MPGLSNYNSKQKYYLRHFCEAGCPVCDRQSQLRNARLITYVTSGRRVAQFARDSAKFVAPDLLFTSLLRGGSPSLRETVPSSWRRTYYLRHFWKAGCPVRERQCQVRCARPIIYTSSGLGAAPELGATTETLTSPNSLRGRVLPPFLFQ